MVDDVQYELKFVRAVRGMETRTIARWQQAGWEHWPLRSTSCHPRRGHQSARPPHPKEALGDTQRNLSPNAPLDLSGDFLPSSGGLAVSDDASLGRRSR